MRMSPKILPIQKRKPHVFNFAPGPSMVPSKVMMAAHEEFFDWQGTGVSVMEIGHRSDEFTALAASSEADLRALIAIPDHYRVLFLAGGATSQFAMVPLNLLPPEGVADYVYTGTWSGKAITEAHRHGRVNLAAALDDAKTPLSVPSQKMWTVTPDAAYLYYTDNETINGVEFHEYPDAGDTLLVSDMTSSLLSKPLDVSRYAAIFAGAQKNIGIAGLTIVIVREDLLGRSRAGLPSMYDYAIYAKHRSMFNTPPVYAWYFAAKVLAWVREEGGVAEMEARAERRSRMLYQAIDASNLYVNQVAPRYRSRMNVPFTLTDERLTERFLSEAWAAGLVKLHGHRIVGGVRASMYNAMPEAGADALVAFMRDFEKKCG